MGPRKIPLELDNGDSEPEDGDYGDYDGMAAEGALTAREGDRDPKARLRARELVELRYLLQRDDRFARALESTRLAIQEMVDVGNPTPVLAMLASLVWRCLCLAWEVDVQTSGGMPKAALRAKVVKLEDELQKVDKSWQKSRRDYFKELCHLRDQVRRLDGKLISHVSNLVYEEDPVMFYKEVEHLPEDTRVHVAEIVEEKLKQLAVKLQGGELVVCESPKAESEEEASELEENPDFYLARERDSRYLIQAAAAQAKKLQHQINDMEAQHKQALQEAEQRRLSAVSLHEADLEHLRHWAMQEREDLLQQAQQRGFQVRLSGEVPRLQLDPATPGSSPRVAPPRTPRSGRSRQSPAPSPRAREGRRLSAEGVVKVPTGSNLLMVSTRSSEKSLTKGSLQVESILRENAAARLQLTEYVLEEGGRHQAESAQALDDAAKEATKQKVKMSALERQLEQSRAELETLRNQGKRTVDRASAETDNIRQKLANTEAENDQLSTEVAKLKAELKLAHQEAAGAKHSLSTLRAEEKDLQQKIEQLDLEKKELSSVADGLREEADHLRAELAASREAAALPDSRRGSMARPRASMLRADSPQDPKRRGSNAQSSRPPSPTTEAGRSGLVQPPELQPFENQVRKVRTRKVFERLFSDSVARDERRDLIRDLFAIAAEDEGMKAFASSAAFSVASRLGARMRMRRADTDNETSEDNVDRQATADSSDLDPGALRAGRSRSVMHSESVISRKDSLLSDLPTWSQQHSSSTQGSHSRTALGKPKAFQQRGSSRTSHSFLEKQDADVPVALVGRGLIPTQDSPRPPSGRRESATGGAVEAADAAIAAQVALAVEGEAWWQNSTASDMLLPVDHAAETAADLVASLGKRGTLEPFMENERLMAALSERSRRVAAPRGGSKVHGSGAAGFRDVPGEQMLGLEAFLHHLEEHGELSLPPRGSTPTAASAAAARRRPGTGAPPKSSASRRRPELGEGLPTGMRAVQAQDLYVQQLAAIAARRPAAGGETAEEIAARWAEALKAMDPQQFPVRIEGILPVPSAVGDQEVVDGLRALVRPGSPSRAAELAATARALGAGGGVPRATSEAALPSLAGPASRRTAAPRRQQPRGESEAETHKRAEALLATRPGSAPEPKGDRLRRVSSAPAARAGSKPVRVLLTGAGAPLAGAGPTVTSAATKR